MGEENGDVTSCGEMIPRPGRGAPGVRLGGNGDEGMGGAPYGRGGGARLECRGLVGVGCIDVVATV